MVKWCITTTLIFIFNIGILHAATLTIDKIPAEFSKLQTRYINGLKNTTTAASLSQLKKELNHAKLTAKESPTYLKQRSILENARDRDIQHIQSRFQASLTKLDKATMAIVDEKYQKELAILQSHTSSQLRSNYIADLQILEKKLINQNNLAGALLVQNERKKIQAGGASQQPANTAQAVQKPSKAAAPASKAKPAAPKTEKIAKKSAPIPNKLSEETPQLYSNSTKGLAGSGQNIKNNIYTFNVQRFGKHSLLTFKGWGTKSNNTIGDVFLIDTTGKRHKVSQWSPNTLKKSTFYDVKGENDLDPIEADISNLVTKAGTYKIEFTYRDGQEALVIYKVMLQSW